MNSVTAFESSQPQELAESHNDAIVVNNTEFRVPSHVSIQIDPPILTLLAADTGSFKLEILIDTTVDVNGSRLFWDQEAETPATVWLSVHRGCGITFAHKKVPSRSGRHTLVKFELPEEGNPRILTAYVNYSVDSRITAGTYYISSDVLAELVTDSGLKVQDVGFIRSPFEIDTHLETKLLMLFFVAIAIFLFVVEWVRIDVVAILMMVLLPELGLLRAGDAFRGLSSNAVIAIIGVMIISFGLNRTGLVNRIIQPLLSLVRRGESQLVVVFSMLIAAISSVMQNTGAAVLFLPAIRLVATQELKIHISRILMPIGMAAILGGTLTMIGTSPLILLNDILPEGMPKFGFLELTPIGIALVIGGMAYLSTIGMKMLSKQQVSPIGKDENDGGVAQPGIAGNYPNINGPFEILFPENYLPKDKPQEIADIRRQFMVNIVAMSRPGESIDIAPHPRKTIGAGAGICVYGPRANVERFAKEYGLMLLKRPIVFRKNLFNPSYAGIAEMIISPRSGLVGKCIRQIRFRETYDVNALALHQNGTIYYRALADRSLKSGDAVLIHGTLEQIQSLKEHHQNFIIVSPANIVIHKPDKAKYALISFLIALALMMVSSFYYQSLPYNPIPLAICLMVGALGMIVTKVMTISEAYRAIDSRTVFLLGGLIPLGMAVSKTGTAAWLAKGIVIGLGSFMSPLTLLIVLAVISCALTMVVSNVGACALLVPLGISLSNQIGVDPRVAAIVVGIGVSNSFILPTHQVNALYMGPGEYRTKDYLKIGGGLSIVYIVILVTVTYLFYL
ncbi:MAG: anion permease [candidate division Zixibacteria bacterium]|nr:anion permease [candidate division Zixibacteria bacterium]